MFFTVICFLFSLSNQLDNKYIDNGHELENFLNIISMRLNIKSLECEFFSTRILNPSFANVTIKRRFVFKYSNENFYISHKFENKRKRERAKVNLYKDEPINLLELLASKITRNTVQMKEMDTYYEHYYFYNRKGSRRTSWFQQNDDGSVREVLGLLGEQRESDCFLCRDGNPRWSIGYIGYYLGGEDYAFDGSFPKRITELLKIHGKTLVRKEGKYRVLFHCVENSDAKKVNIAKIKGNLSELGYEYNRWYSFEVWLDDNDDIVKIVEVDYFPLIYGEKFVENLCSYKTQSLFFPYEIRKVYNFSNFMEFPDGVRLPLKTFVTVNRDIRFYALLLSSKICPEESLLVERYNNGEIKSDEFRVMFHCLGPREDLFVYTIELEIIPETLKVNQQISEKEFIAPEPDINHLKEEEITNQQNKTNQEKNEYIKMILYLASFTILIIISIYVTRKYFNCGIQKVEMANNKHPKED